MQLLTHEYLMGELISVCGSGCELTPVDIRSVTSWNSPLCYQRLVKQKNYRDHLV